MPDYSNYTLEELIEARESIDVDKYPERTAELDALIQEKSTQTKPSPEEIYSSTDNNEIVAPKLPLIEIFLEALASPIRQIKQIPKMVLPGLFLALPFMYVSMTLQIDLKADEFEIPSGHFLPFMPAALLFLFGITLVVVTWHRIVLLGEGVFKELGLTDWLGIGLRFAGWFVLHFLAIVVFLIPWGIVLALLGLTTAATGEEGTSAWMTLLSLFGSLYIYYFIGRWSLIFPAAAVGQRGLGLGWSWSMTQGNELQMIAIVGIFPFILDLSLSVFPEDAPIVLDILYGIVAFYLFLVQICLLSLSYQYLTKDNENAEKPSKSIDDAENLETTENPS